MKIAYLISMYPDVSHTFIMREVQALRERATFSIRRPVDRNILGADARQEAASTRWLVPPSVGQFAAALVWVIATRPVLACRALWVAALKRTMTLGQRAKWLCYFAEAVLLARWLVTEAFEHLHCHFGNNGASTGMLAARLAGIPFSVTCHGSELPEIKKHRLAEKVAAAAFVACVSHHGRAQLMLACHPKLWSKLHVVHCGAPLICADLDTREEGSARILCVGRLSPEKGHLVLLDALAGLRDKGVDFRCTLVGDGPMRAMIETRADQLGLTELLTFTGSLDPDRVAELYPLADIVVLASFSEGVPVVLMEAMAHGRPVVATRVGGVPELVKDGHSGLIVPPGDTVALAGALRRILEDPELAANAGHAGTKRVRQEFSLGTSAHKLMELFEGVRRPDATGNVPADGGRAPCPVRLTPPDC